MLIETKQLDLRMIINETIKKNAMETQDFNIENIDPKLISEAMQKVLRQRNAELFIDKLPAKLTDNQREHFIKVLCDYEKFLDKQ